MTEVRWKRYRWDLELPAVKLGDKVRGGTPYEAELLADIAAERPVGAAFDVGAYFGNHSAFMAVVCGLRVHAFEADPARAQLLRRNVERLGVTVHDWAVGAGGKAHWVKGQRLAAGGDVSVYAIDQVLDVAGLAVVKLDIEGMERQAIGGMWHHLERDRPLVYVEAHEGDPGQDLKQLGYVKEARLEGRMDKWACR